MSLVPSRSRTSRISRITTLALAAAAFAAPTASASAGVGIQVSPQTVVRGNAVTFSAAGFISGEAITFLVGPADSEAEAVATRTADANGAAAIRLTINRRATPGRYVAVACQQSCSIKATQSFRIIAPTTRAQAIAKVRAVLRRNRSRCQMTIGSISASSRGSRWLVTARVSTFGNSGRARWNVLKAGGRTTPADQLAFEISNGCQ